MDFVKKFYIIILISLFINLFLMFLIYNSNLTQTINYRVLNSHISFDRTHLSEREFKNLVEHYHPTCGGEQFFPSIYDITNYVSFEAINDLNTLLGKKLRDNNDYSSNSSKNNYFINIINSPSTKFTFKQIVDEFALKGYPDSSLKFYYDENLASYDDDYLLSLRFQFRDDQLSDNIANEIAQTVRNFFENVFDKLYKQSLSNNKFLIETARIKTLNYIKEIENSEGYEEESRFVYCLIKNKFNLNQIKSIMKQFNQNNLTHNLKFILDNNFSAFSKKPKTDEILAILIIPVIFFFLTILFCLFKFRSSKK